MRLVSAMVLGAAMLAGAGPAAAQDKLSPDLARFRATYKELVEINTSASVGSCTRAAEAMKAHLVAAGYPDSNLHMVIPPEAPKHGNLIAELPGSDPKLKAVLLLAHIDVVEADAKDWTHDPFVLREEGGFFYGRGAQDDKSMAAAFVDAMVRFKEEKFKPKRTIKLGLTCGEEGGSTNGVRYILDHDRPLIEAAFALNEGGGGLWDVASGKRIYLAVQAGEKLPSGFNLEVTNPGGHSSRPRADNAIYQLARALLKVEAIDFPVQFNDVTRGYFEKMAVIMADPEGTDTQSADMKAALKGDMAATKRLEANPIYNSLLHTTCVATQLSGGHAPNALPQRATAGVNCRIFPGMSPDEVEKTIVAAINDPDVKVTRGGRGPGGRTTAVVPPELTKEIMDPIRKISADMFPGVTVLPALTAGATDGSSLNAAGIPTYGVSGMFTEPLYNAHGLNERIGVKQLYDGRDFLYRLAKAYGSGK